LTVEGKGIELGERIHLFGLGKAASFEISAMRDLLIEEDLQKRIHQCVSYTKLGNTIKKDFLELEGDHPILTDKNLEMTLGFIDHLKAIKEEDSLIFCLSGGGSALLELPKPDFSLDEIQELNQNLLYSGKSILEVNKERKKYSQVKGGGLRRFIETKNIIQLVTSDIPGDDINFVSSGPLGNGDFESVVTMSSEIIIDALCEKSDRIKGEVYDCSLEEALNVFKVNLPERGKCLVSGGEIPVRVSSKKAGAGGRNTHFVLSLAEQIFRDPKNHDIKIMSLATDGEDGNTDCAGAYLDYELFQKLNSKDYLDTFSSYDYFQKIGCLIKTGPTGSNVMDLRFIWR
jgi:hydroxypyruvate reductase